MCVLSVCGKRWGIGQSEQIMQKDISCIRKSSLAARAIQEAAKKCKQKLLFIFILYVYMLCVCVCVCVLFGIMCMCVSGIVRMLCIVCAAMCECAA